MSKPNKPICLAYKEAEQEIMGAIAKTINKHSLPLFLAEIIVKNAYDQIKNEAQKERAMAKQFYKQQIKEHKVETEGSGNE